MAPHTSTTSAAVEGASHSVNSQHMALSINETLETVLRHVSVRQRLSSCSLVCTDWHAAALAVTTELDMVVCERHILAWLNDYGSNLCKLAMHSGDILAAEMGLASMAQLTQLTRLELETTTAPPAVMRTVGKSMQGLQHLSMFDIDWGPLISTSERRELSDCAHDLWKGCTQLTTLTMYRCDLDDACVMGLGANLLCLKELDVSSNALMRSTSLQPLPVGLTKLNVSNNMEDFDPSDLLQPRPSPAGLSMTPTEGEEPDSSTDGTVGMPNLRHLDVSGLTVRHPNCLSSLTTLENLSLLDVIVPDTSTLLSSISHLTHLKFLWYKCDAVDFITAQELKAALKPLVHLQSLGLTYYSYGPELDLATADQEGNQQSSDQCLFAGLSFPKLHTLMLNLLNDNLDGMHFGLRPSDIRPLVHACPAVTRLTLYIQLDRPSPAPGTAATAAEPPWLSALSELSQTLVELTVAAHSPGFVDPDRLLKGGQLHDGDMQCLAQLHGLRDLMVQGCGPCLTDRGLLALTALKNLEVLRINDLEGSGISNEVRYTLDKLSTPLTLKSKYSKRGWIVASVSDQLQEICKNSPQLWRETQESLIEELKAARLDAQQAKKDAAEQRRLLKAQQQLTRTVERQNAELKRQLAEAQAHRGDQGD